MAAGLVQHHEERRGRHARRHAAHACQYQRLLMSAMLSIAACKASRRRRPSCPRRRRASVSGKDKRLRARPGSSWWQPAF